MWSGIVHTKMLIKRIDENNRINPLINPAIVFNGVKRASSKTIMAMAMIMFMEKKRQHGEKEKRIFTKKTNNNNKNAKA